MSFQGTHGTAIYLRRFLSTMFEISDVLVDKDEVAMALNIRIDLPETDTHGAEQPAEVTVSESVDGVSKTHITEILCKVAKVIAAQGFSCCSCPKVQYKLLPLSSECKEAVIVPGNTKGDTPVRFLMTMICQDNREIFRFDVRLEKGDAR